MSSLWWRRLTGIGFWAQIEPAGTTAMPSKSLPTSPPRGALSVTKCPVMFSRLPSGPPHRRACEPVKRSGLLLKHSSVNGLSALHSRYWYPPPARRRERSAGSGQRSGLLQRQRSGFACGCSHRQDRRAPEGDIRAYETAIRCAFAKRLIRSGVVGQRR